MVCILMLFVMPALLYVLVACIFIKWNSSKRFRGNVNIISLPHDRNNSAITLTILNWFLLGECMHFNLLLSISRSLALSPRLYILFFFLVMQKFCHGFAPFYYFIGSSATEYAIIWYTMHLAPSFFHPVEMIFAPIADSCIARIRSRYVNKLFWNNLKWIWQYRRFSQKYPNRIQIDFAPAKIVWEFSNRWMPVCRRHIGSRKCAVHGGVCTVQAEQPNRQTID